MAEWTEERIAKLSNEELQSLRQNAVNLGHTEIAELCEKEQMRHKPVRAKVAYGIIDDHSDQYVSEFHLVCPGELGIIRNQDGTIWTGTWVVAEEHAANAVRYGALVSLPASRAEPSYLQGAVIAWRKSPQEPRYAGKQLTQVKEGIDFLSQPSDYPLPWKGEAAGEKGYASAPLAR